MKKWILLVVFVLLGWTGCLLAATDELHGVTGVEWSSKYLWRGFEVYGSRPTIHPFVDLDLFGTGFGLNVTGHIPQGSGTFHGLGVQQFQRWDYLLYYHNMLFADQPYQTMYMVGYRYFNFPKLSSHDTTPFPPPRANGVDLQEMLGAFSFPKLLGVEGLVPTYVLVKLWPSNSCSAVANASGFAHIFMLDYGWRTTCPITDKEQVLNLHSEIVWNDGVGPAGQNVDHDWTNLVLGASTDYDLGNNVTFTPGLFHQISMDKSLGNDNKSDTWLSLMLKYKF